MTSPAPRSNGQSPVREPTWVRLCWGLVNIVQLVFTLLWSAWWISTALLVLLVTRSRSLALAMARRVWAPVLLRGAFARVEVEGAAGLDWGQAYLIAANHQSFIDIPALFVALPVPLRFVVKRELAAVPFLGWYISAMGMVFLDRGARRGAVESLRRSVEILRGGSSVVCFPEGTRSRDGSIRPFKSGALAMAIEAGAPVLPVAITGTGRVLPPEGFRVRPGTIRVCCGRPIPTADLSQAQRGELARRVEEEVRQLAATPHPVDSGQ